jgi:hypothetical protein
MFLIYYLSLGVAWMAASAFVSVWLAKRFSNRFVRWLIALSALAVLMPLPLADEIVGKRQFEALCRHGATLEVDAARIKGRQVRLQVRPVNQPVPGIAVPVLYTRVEFRDAETSEPLGAYGWYVAEGGWFIRTFGIGEGGGMLLASGKSFCSPAKADASVAADYGFQIVK